MNSTELAILNTLAYYDIFDHPLTSFEIYKYLMPVTGHAISPHKLEYNDILTKLDLLKNHKIINSQDGFFFLPKKDHLVTLRNEHHIYSEQKWRIIKQIMVLSLWIPFVEGICISGSVNLGNAKQNSDVDLVIFTSKNRLWTARYLLTGWLWALRKRRYGQNIKNRFCLNTYIDIYNPQIDKDKNKYLPDMAQVFGHATPIIAGDYYATYLSANRWMSNHFVAFPWHKLPNGRQLSQNWLSKALKLTLQAMLSRSVGDYVESCAESYQKTSIYNKQRNVSQENKISVLPFYVLFNSYQRDFFIAQTHKEIFLNIYRKVSKIKNLSANFR